MLDNASLAKTSACKATLAVSTSFTRAAQFRYHRPMTTLHPKKLLLTKWTAVNPVARHKHFLVTKVIFPEDSTEAIEWVDIESVFGRASRRIAWRDLRDQTQWRQGWL